MNESTPADLLTIPRLQWRFVSVATIVTVIATLGDSPARGQPLPFPPTQPQFDRQSFETGNPRAVCESAELQAALAAHALDTRDSHSGQQCELLVFRPARDNIEGARIALPLKACRVFPELEAKVWVRGTFASVQVGVRLRFPHQIDPRTSAPLAVDVFGESYSNVGQWQQLTCATTQQLVSTRLLRARSQLSDELRPVVLDEREPYVDQLVLLVSIPPAREGAEFQALQLDDVEFGPLVAPERTAPVRITPARAGSPLTFNDDRVRRDGRPFFPILIPYHQEPLEQISGSGVNMLWIPDYQDRPLLAAIESLDLGAIAAPPQPTPEEVLTGRSTIASLPDWTSPVWAWMLGFEIPADDRSYVAGWAKQVRDADRQLQRPIMGDVAGAEQNFHRTFSFLSASRFSVHTSLSPRDSFLQLRARRDAALPGKPMFCFVQTEASDAILQALGNRASPVVEPEQILHQAYAAVAAGFKGIGFWKQIPFNVNGEGLDERIAAMQVFAAHARILEPFLSTSRVAFEIPVIVDGPTGRNSRPAASPLASRWNRPVQQASFEPAPESGLAAEIRAAVLQTDYGLLLLPVWFEPNGQYVPGPQHAQNVRFLLPGVGDVAQQAWEVTSTGISQSNLELQRIAGGTELVLAKFDQSTAIILSSDQQQMEALRQRARDYRHVAAEAYVSLAEKKLRRVAQVHDELTAQGHPHPQSAALLESAARSATVARQEMLADHAEEARIASQRALQFLRTLQRGCWETAVASVGNPATSLELCSFQTLPGHWRLIEELAGIRFPDSNRLTGGSFENDETVMTHWGQDPDSNRAAVLDLGPGGPARGQVLSLSLPEGLAGRPFALLSPPVEVSPGELLLITGQVRIPQTLRGVDAQFLIFDTQVGRAGAVRFPGTATDWTTFRMLRRVHESGNLRLRFELSGAGAVQLDDVRVQVAPTGRGAGG